MPLINSTGEGIFEITDTKLYVPVVTLSMQDHAKLLQQLKSNFRRTINCNKYQWDPEAYPQKIYLSHLSCETQNGRTSHANYYLPRVEIKNYSVVIDGKNFFDQPINEDTKTYENIRKITTGKGDDYTIDCLLD